MDGGQRLDSQQRVLAAHTHFFQRFSGQVPAVQQGGSSVPVGLAARQQRTVGIDEAGPIGAGAGCKQFRQDVVHLHGDFQRADGAVLAGDGGDQAHDMLGGGVGIKQAVGKIQHPGALGGLPPGPGHALHAGGRVEDGQHLVHVVRRGKDADLIEVRVADNDLFQAGNVVIVKIQQFGGGNGGAVLQLFQVLHQGRGVQEHLCGHGADLGGLVYLLHDLASAQPYLLPAGIDGHGAAGVQRIDAEPHGR